MSVYGDMATTIQNYMDNVMRLPSKREAFKEAIIALMEKDEKENCFELIKAHSSVYFVNYREKKIYKGEVYRVVYNDGKLGEFDIIMEDGTCQGFVREDVSTCLFSNYRKAELALIKGHGII